MIAITLVFTRIAIINASAFKVYGCTKVLTSKTALNSSGSLRCAMGLFRTCHPHGFHSSRKSNVSAYQRPTRSSRESIYETPWRQGRHCSRAEHYSVKHRPRESYDSYSRERYLRRLLQGHEYTPDLDHHLDHNHAAFPRRVSPLECELLSHHGWHVSHQVSTGFSDWYWTPDCLHLYFLVHDVLVRQTLPHTG